MPANINNVGKQDLIDVPLPQHGKTYTVISHKFVLDEVKQQIVALGFKVTNVLYRMTAKGDVAHVVYHMEHGSDPDLGLMFSWVNSYDKTMRFRCATGAYVKLTDSDIIAGDMSNYGRKHTGDAKLEVQQHITAQLQGASAYFTELVKHKDFMMTVKPTERMVADFMGQLFFNQDIITSGQLISVKKSFDHRVRFKDDNGISLWEIYSDIIDSLKKSHPKSWMEQQKELHILTKTMFFPTPAIVPANQIDLEDQAGQLTESTDEQTESTDEATSTDSPVNVLGGGDGPLGDPVLQPEPTPEPVSLDLENYEAVPSIDDDAPKASHANEEEAVAVAEAEEEVAEVLSEVNVEVTSEEPTEAVEPTTEFASVPDGIPAYVGGVDPITSEKPSISIAEAPATEATEAADPFAVDATKVVVTPDLQIQVQEEGEAEVKASVEESPVIENHDGDIEFKPTIVGVDSALTEADISAVVLTDGGIQTMDEVKAEEAEETEEEVEANNATPLEEQVAGAEVEPVTEAEKVVSQEPVIDKPEVVDFDTAASNSNSNGNSNGNSIAGPNFDF